MLAALLRSGAPAVEAIALMCEGLDEASCAAVAKAWMRHRLVKTAQCAYWGGRSYAELTDDERRKEALVMAQNKAAYIWQTRHPLEVDAGTRTLMLNVRDNLQAIESGTAGKANAVEEFLRKFESLQQKRAKTGKGSEAVQ